MNRLEKFGKLGVYVNSENALAVFGVLFALSLPFSESFISIFSGFLLLQAILFFRLSKSNWRDKSLWIVVSIFFVYIIGLLACRDPKLGEYEIKKTMFWLVIVGGVALTPKLPEKKVWYIFFAFLIAVTLSSFVSVVKLVFSDYFGIENFRDANFVSHISFSFEVTLSLSVLISSFFFSMGIISRVPLVFKFLWIAWLFVFLVVLKSMLGIIACYFSISFLFSVLLRSTRFVKIRIVSFVIMALILIVPILYIGKVVNDFYKIKDCKPELVDKYTRLGNPYVFNFDSRERENGHFVWWYFCEPEMKDAWNARSDIKYNDKDKKGYSIGGTLIRYLTSKGLRKDAEGVAQLTDEDVRNIQNGFANYRNAHSMFSLYPRVYGSIWELDHYYRTGDASGQSLSQRIEYSKAAFQIIKENFWLGVGTGNFNSAYFHAFKEINSKLAEDHYGTAHNQYLSYLLKFGVIGFLFIVLALVLAVAWTGNWRNLVFVTFFIDIMVGNFGESIFETHVGLAFFTFFFALFLWHSPGSLKRGVRASNT
jgi:hypothetical protein